MAGPTDSRTTATCRIAKPARQEHSESEQPGADKPDVKSLSSMLAARWKAGSVAESPKAQEVRAGQVRSFRITTLDPAARKIDVELVSKLRIQCSQTLHHARPAVRGFCKAIGRGRSTSLRIEPCSQLRNR